MARSNGIEIEADDQWQRREWRAQRVAWTLGALILIGAAAGLFGNGGPLATAEISGQGFTVTYERFDRRDAPSEMTIALDPSAGEVTIELASKFTVRIDIENVIPEPTDSTLTERGLAMTFAQEDGVPEEIVIEYRVDTSGLMPIDVSVDGRRARGRAFVYP